MLEPVLHGRAAYALLVIGLVTAAGSGGIPADASGLSNRGAIVLVSDRGGHSGLYARTPPGVEPVVYRRLTSGGNEPEYSPNGQLIAYTGGGGQDRHIVVMNADGSGSRAVTPRQDGRPESDPTWSPDGTRLAFTAVLGSGGRANEEVFTVDLLGGGIEQLTDSPGADWWPTWSSSGLIAFVSDRGSKSAIYTMDATGAKLTALGISDARWPAWSPDGQSLAYQGSTTAIHVRDGDGDDDDRVVSEGSMNGYPAWSPDGKKVLYRRVFMDGNSFHHRLYTVDADGTTDPVLLSDGTSNDYMADWQPVLPPVCSSVQVCP